MHPGRVRKGLGEPHPAWPLGEAVACWSLEESAVGGLGLGPWAAWPVEWAELSPGISLRQVPVVSATPSAGRTQRWLVPRVTPLPSVKPKPDARSFHRPRWRAVAGAEPGAARAGGGPRDGRWVCPRRTGCSRVRSPGPSCRGELETGPAGPPGLCPVRCLLSIDLNMQFSCPCENSRQPARPPWASRSSFPPGMGRAAQESPCGVSAGLGCLGAPTAALPVPGPVGPAPRLPSRGPESHSSKGRRSRGGLWP